MRRVAVLALLAGALPAAAEERRFEPPELPACDELRAREAAMRGLPRNWVMLTQKDGELVRTSQCNHEDKFVIVDSPKGYTLREEPIEGGNWYEATSVTRVDGGVQFETDRGTATLIWPARPDVAQFICPKMGMSANKVGKFKVQKYKCD